MPCKATLKGIWLLGLYPKKFEMAPKLSEGLALSMEFECVIGPIRFEIAADLCFSASNLKVELARVVVDRSFSLN